VSEEEILKLWAYWKEKRTEAVHQAINDADRIGLGEFVKKTVKELEHETKPLRYDRAVHGDLNWRIFGLLAETSRGARLRTPTPKYG
jgi:hypothetical protein